MKKKIIALALTAALVFGSVFSLTACGDNASGSSDGADTKPSSVTIAIPNDATNGGRALLLLESLGYIKVKDSAGHAITSNTVTVTVTGTIVITKQPDKQITIMEGDPVTLSLKANGTGLTYQWYCQKKGQTSFSQWNGRTHATETCNPGLSWDGMQLYCRITDSYGNTIDSDTVKVTVYPQIVITSQPYSQTVKLGKSLTLSLTAEGSGLTYQWYCKKAGDTGWKVWNGYTAASISATANANWNGMKVFCVMADQYGNTTSSGYATVYIVS